MVDPPVPERCRVETNVAGASGGMSTALISRPAGALARSGPSPRLAAGSRAEQTRLWCFAHDRTSSFVSLFNGGRHRDRKLGDRDSGPRRSRPRFLPFEAVFRLFRYGGTRYGLTARTADRAVPVELIRFLAVNHAIRTPLIQRITDGLNHGKESSKLNQDCTICRTCRPTLPDAAVLKGRGNGIKWRE